MVDDDFTEDELRRMRDILASRKQEPPAYHEASHAVASLVLGVDFTEALLTDPDGDEKTFGRVRVIRRGVTWADAAVSDELTREVYPIVFMAGCAGEARVRGRSLEEALLFTSGRDDRRVVAEILSAVDRDPEREFPALMAAAAGLVDTHWLPVVDVAEALIERRAMTEAEVRRVAFPDPNDTGSDTTADLIPKESGPTEP